MQTGFAFGDKLDLCPPMVRIRNQARPDRCPPHFTLLGPLPSIRMTQHKLYPMARRRDLSP
jgi:hypothetical protein